VLGEFDGSRGEEIKSGVGALDGFLGHAKFLGLGLLDCFIVNFEKTFVGGEFSEDNVPFAIFFSCDVVLAFDGFGIRGLRGVGGMPGGLIVFVQQDSAFRDRDQFLRGQRRGVLRGSVGSGGRKKQSTFQNCSSKFFRPQSFSLPRTSTRSNIPLSN
jgi:hypothetical protein